MNPTDTSCLSIFQRVLQEVLQLFFSLFSSGPFIHGLRNLPFLLKIAGFRSLFISSSSSSSSFSLSDVNAQRCSSHGVPLLFLFDCVLLGLDLFICFGLSFLPFDFFEIIVSCVIEWLCSRGKKWSCQHDLPLVGRQRVKEKSEKIKRLEMSFASIANPS